MPRPGRRALAAALVFGFQRASVEPHNEGTGYAVVMNIPGTAIFIGLDKHNGHQGERFAEHRTDHGRSRRQGDPVARPPGGHDWALLRLLAAAPALSTPSNLMDETPLSSRAGEFRLSLARSPRRRGASGLVKALMSLVAIGLPSAAHAGVAVIHAAPPAVVAEPSAVWVPVPAPSALELPSPPAGTPAPESPVEPAPPPPDAAVPAPAPEPEQEPEPCTASLAGVAAAGLTLPAGADYQCPSTRFAHQGAACWDEWPCPGTAFIAINMSRLQGATPEYLRHVVAHEICHIIDFRYRGWTTEPRADACAAEWGF